MYSHVSAVRWSRDVFRDFELNEICSELCVEKTLTCITKCDPTDSECISTCLRAEITCVNSKSKAFLICDSSSFVFDVDFHGPKLKS